MAHSGTGYCLTASCLQIFQLRSHYNARSAAFRTKKAISVVDPVNDLEGCAWTFAYLQLSFIYFLKVIWQLIVYFISWPHFVLAICVWRERLHGINCITWRGCVLLYHLACLSVKALSILNWSPMLWLYSTIDVIWLFAHGCSEQSCRDRRSDIIRATTTGRRYFAVFRGPVSTHGR